MSETERVFENLIKSTRERALDSYRTALKKKIEDKIRYAEDQLSLMKLESCGYDKWQKIIDELKAVKHIIDSTTI